MDEDGWQSQADGYHPDETKNEVNGSNKRDPLAKGEEK